MKLKLTDPAHVPIFRSLVSPLQAKLWIKDKRLGQDRMGGLPECGLAIESPDFWNAAFLLRQLGVVSSLPIRFLEPLPLETFVINSIKLLYVKKAGLRFPNIMHGVIRLYLQYLFFLVAEIELQQQ